MTWELFVAGAIVAVAGLFVVAVTYRPILLPVPVLSQRERETLTAGGCPICPGSVTAVESSEFSTLWVCGTCRRQFLLTIVPGRRGPC